MGKGVKKVTKKAMKSKDVKKVVAKKAMKSSSMKKGRGMKKAKRESIIARGRFRKFQVLSGKKKHTVGGLKKEDLTKNKYGKIVSKKLSSQGKKSRGWLRVP